MDHHARLVERWRPEDGRPEIVTGTPAWHPVAEIEPLVLELPALFAESLEGLEDEG